MQTKTAFEISENPHAFPRDMREAAIERFSDLYEQAMDFYHVYRELQDRRAAEEYQLRGVAIGISMIGRQT